MHQTDKSKKTKSLFGRYEEFPANWEIKTFNELFEFLRTGTNSRDDLQEYGDIQYIHYGDIHAKWHSVLNCDLEEIPWIDYDKVQGLPLLKEGDLIIADASEDYEGSGASILLKNVRNRKIVSGLHTIALRNIDNSIVSDFKRYLNSIKFVKNQIIAYVTGISVYGLSKNNLKKVKVPLPPAVEQQKIAEILSNMDELIQITDKIIEQTQRLKKGLMQRLLTRGIGHTKFKKTELGEIPEEWTIVSLDNICINITDGKHGDCKNENDSGYYFISAKDIFNGKIHYENARQITKSDFLDTHKRTKIEPGDLLLTNSGSIGKLAVVQNLYNTNQTTFQKSVAILKPDVTKIFNYFLYYYLHHNQKRLEIIASGSSQKNLLLIQLRTLRIPLPLTIEQEKIASKLSRIDDLIKIQRIKKSNAEVLKKGLIQKLLTGKIRVKT